MAGGDNLSGNMAGHLYSQVVDFEEWLLSIALPAKPN